MRQDLTQEDRGNSVSIAKAVESVDIATETPKPKEEEQATPILDEEGSNSLVDGSELDAPIPPNVSDPPSEKPCGGDSEMKNVKDMELHDVFNYDDVGEHRRHCRHAKEFRENNDF
jgi:hypothetical protein